MLQDHNDALTNAQTSINLMEKKFKNQHEEFNNCMVDLTDRIEKAEHDRMHKYYKQVSELND